ARAGVAARALAALPAEAAVRLLAGLSRHGDGEARAAFTAVGQALQGPDAALLYEHLAEVYAAAAEEELLEVTSLLVSPPARRAFVAPRDRSDARLAHLTLGHKKTMARTHRDPDLLARLAAEGDPPVVRELLRNPLLTEPFAVRIASRRPMRPETLRLLAESRRWRTRTAVMLAVVKNPWTETGVALKLLPFLPAGGLDELTRDGSVHPLLRAAAERLRDRRRGG
ncbi:MAG TPA: hypothetical protein VFP50_12405, partial [Anaeromyxobacteraceae bacterium]|nr:hypothetical protein [Anaeromyxobacteraceae bacterium]